MSLFYIQDEDRPGYVFAEDYHQAVKKWIEAVLEENPGEESITLPKGVQHLADDDEIILERKWIHPIKA